VTVRDVLEAMLRRWYVVVAVVLAVAALGLFFARDDGLYFTRTVVTFSTPGEDSPFEEGGSSEAGIIAFAASIATELNDGVEPLRYASADAPFYGAGIRQGVIVGIPSTGGQWAVDYRRAAIELQIVSPDREWVAERQAALLAQVQAITETQQDAVGTGDGFVTTAIDPLALRIDHITPTRTTRMLAWGALAVVAVLVSGWAALRGDAAAAKRRRHAVARRPDAVSPGRDVVVHGPDAVVHGPYVIVQGKGQR
jgi:hypothetical protein